MTLADTIDSLQGKFADVCEDDADTRKLVAEKLAIAEHGATQAVNLVEWIKLHFTPDSKIFRIAVANRDAHNGFVFVLRTLLTEIDTILQ